MSTDPKSEAIDYNHLMQANLTRVFSERDAGRRIVAIRELYAEDAVLYEPDASAKGHAAISEAVTALLAQLPPNFVFSAAGPAIGHHNLGRLKWRSGPPDGPVAVTGMDVAHFEEGRIHSIYVFLEPAGAQTPVLQTNSTKEIPVAKTPKTGLCPSLPILRKRLPSLVRLVHR